MALPVLCGPNRCALVYSQDRQPLIELSLRVNLPVVELLRALSQVAPRTAEPAPPRSSLAHQRGNPSSDSGQKEATAQRREKLVSSSWDDWYPNSEWQQAPVEFNGGARHSWETCPPAPFREWDTPQVSAEQQEEQKQLLWALTNKTSQHKTDVTAPQPCAPTQRKQATTTSSPPRPRHHPKGPAAVSKAQAAQSKRPPPTASGEKAEDNEEFDPPARPGAPQEVSGSVVCSLFLSMAVVFHRCAAIACCLIIWAN